MKKKTLVSGITRNVFKRLQGITVYVRIFPQAYQAKKSKIKIKKILFYFKLIAYKVSTIQFRTPGRTKRAGNNIIPQSIGYSLAMKELNYAARERRSEAIASARTIISYRRNMCATREG